MEATGSFNKKQDIPADSIAIPFLDIRTRESVHYDPGSVTRRFAHVHALLQGQAKQV